MYSLGKKVYLFDEIIILAVPSTARKRFLHKSVGYSIESNADIVKGASPSLRYKSIGNIRPNWRKCNILLPFLY